MPGVLIIETLAQAASILILKSPHFYKKTAYLGAIHKARFRQMVRPGDVLKLNVVMKKSSIINGNCGNTSACERQNSL